MQKKSYKRQIQAQNTKERIKDCAIELFQEKGYYNTTVEEIAERAKSSIGGFYYHFKSKDEIMIFSMQVLDNKYTEFFNKILTDPKFSHLNAIEKIKAVMIYIVKQICSGGQEFARVSYSYFIRDEETRIMMVNHERKYFKIMEYLINKGKEEDLIQDNLAAKDVLDYITILIRGIVVDWCVNRNSYNIEVMCSSIIDLFLFGILKNKEQ
ncbi:MAG: TetR/AcrR family transcriptional regulator [Sedimentibacter sp.]|uniref:TetR/AcrR family transcriptional regulator n=1 Tax=Sedimentibacter sp. TaxID=1960295 RepID=UPI00315876A2